MMSSPGMNKANTLRARVIFAMPRGEQEHLYWLNINTIIVNGISWNKLESNVRSRQVYAAILYGHKARGEKYKQHKRIRAHESKKKLFVKFMAGEEQKIPVWNLPLLILNRPILALHTTTSIGIEWQTETESLGGCRTI